MAKAGDIGHPHRIAISEIPLALVDSLASGRECHACASDTDTVTRLQLLREIVPTPPVHLLVPVESDYASDCQFSGGRTLGLDAAIFEVRAPRRLVAAIDEEDSGMH